MAVEARHVNLLNQQRNSSGFVYNPSTQMGSMADNFLPIQANTSVNTESGLTFNLPTNDVAAPRKRSRDSFHPSNNTSSDVLPLVQQDINSIISHHTKKIRLELEEQQKHQARMLVSAIGERVMKKMKEKDEEIQRMGKINLVLQERVKSLYMENQLWRDLAQTNEATANSLRSNLEQVLAHVSEERLSAVAVEEDVESCCGSSNEGAGDKSNRMCRRCGERESCVLLLPCRHLCLCTVCGSSLHHACPLCNSNMNATLHVNMSS